MKKITVCFVMILAFAFLVSGCGGTELHEADEIPSLEELTEINDLNNVFLEHTNVYVNVVSKSEIDDYNYTEEVIYVKGDGEINYHKRLKGASDENYDYTSSVGNGFYYWSTDRSMAMLDEGETDYIDYTLMFTSEPVGRGYIENGQIVYHSYIIYEADEWFDAFRYDYTLYFNKDTKLLEKLSYVSYSEKHEVDSECSIEVFYDVADIENKFDKTAYEIITESDSVIELEVIANYNTPEQASYSFIATTDAELCASFSNLTYMLYTDPECLNLVSTLDEYAGTKKMTLYAKILEHDE